MAEKQFRLDKFLSDAANITRKEAKQCIGKGRVSVNGITEKNPDRKVTSSECICLDKKELCRAEKVYLMLHKPSGVISATEDGKEQTVLDLIRANSEMMEKIGKTELFPVGRLDKDTEGLLLITNDGELSHQLLSPKKHVEKVYYARLDKEPPKDAGERFANGIQVGKEYRALPAKLTILQSHGRGTEVLIGITEGKFHQIKRMCHELGCEVLYLKRLSMGGLALDETLAPGEARELSEDEIRMLKERNQNTGF